MNQTSSNTSLDSIIELMLSDKFVETASQIPQETLEFASNDANREFIVTSIFASLKNKEPDTATSQQSEEIADKLIQYAKIQLGK